MSDASAAQLLASALGGGVLVGLLNAGLRVGEFRREDRARWVLDRRAAYAGYIDGVTACMAECAPLAVFVRVATLEDDEGEVRDRAKHLAREAYDHWLNAQPHHAVLRLLANAKGLKALEDLQEPLHDLSAIIAIEAGGRFEAELRTLTDPVDDAMSRLIEVARRDIGA